MSLELRGVTKRVGAETYIYETDLALVREGFNVLLGATNAGKTTLMKLMAGLEQPTTGEVWFRGGNVTGVIPRRRNVSLVHQFFINYPNLDVFENIASPLRVAGLPRAEIARRVGEAADLLHLTPMLRRRPHELSGGQQQRTALARAIVKDSDLVLLDEPLANLDYKLREELRDQLPALFAGRGAVVVYATSEPSEALDARRPHRDALRGTGDPVRPDPGVLPRAGGSRPPPRVFSDPPINAAPVEKRGGEIVLLDHVRWPAAGAAAAIPDGGYTLGLRPHFVTPDRAGPGSVPLKGTVQITELSGSESVAHFAVGDRTWVAQSNGVHPYRVGAVTDFYLDVGRAPLFRPRGAEGGLMARIGLKAMRHAYGPDPKGPDDYALKRVDIEWANGGAYALLGPSGCGKTTLLNIISGLIVPSEGRVLFDDRDVTHAGADRAQHRPGVPVPGHLRHHDGLRQPRLPAAQPRRPARPGRRPRPHHRGHARADGHARPPRRRAHRRRQAEDLAWAAAWCARTSTSSCSTSR